ncbi:MAG: UDP-N-acetylmuramoyl-tripeptide--D-alanyl-D-alanine ligase [Candidatus Saccharimonadales bacterium]
MFLNFLRLLRDFYGPVYPVVLVQQIKRYYYEIGEYLAWYWQAKTFRPAKVRVGLMGWLLVAGYFVLLAGLVFAAVLAWQAGRWQLAMALLITYPLVLAHVITVFVVLAKAAWYIAHPKKLLRYFVCITIEHYVKRLRRKHDFVIVAVAGSVGKTSTKAAIATMLKSAGKRVQIQEGNYNDRVTVPLVLFGLSLSRLFNPGWWLKTMWQMRRTVRAKEYPYDVVVLELGTDGPGQLRHFDYLQPDIGVLTAVAPEHMEYFKTLDAVADEELTLLSYAGKALVNIDGIDAKYLKGYKYKAYSISDKSAKAEFRATKRTGESLHGQTVSFELNKEKVTSAIAYLGEQGATIALAAAAAAKMLELSKEQIHAGLEELKPFSGRMQILQGIKGSTIIDDTYNASPLAVKAALDVVYAHHAPQRIAVLGDMNELGDMSPEAHMDIGRYCDPNKVELVVTIGPASKQYVAPQAEKAGCNVASFDSPYKAGEYLSKQLEQGALVLVKGSQNRVFAEESIKSILANSDDESRLVRQSNSWMRIKEKQFL